MSNHQGDSVNRQASQAGQERTRQAEDARMNAENAQAAASRNTTSR
jgi:hypothetical protein